MYYVGIASVVRTLACFRLRDSGQNKNFVLLHAQYANAGRNIAYHCPVSSARQWRPPQVLMKYSYSAVNNTERKGNNTIWSDKYGYVPNQKRSHVRSGKDRLNQNAPLPKTLPKNSTIRPSLYTQDSEPVSIKLSTSQCILRLLLTCVILPASRHGHQIMLPLSFQPAPRSIFTKHQLQCCFCEQR